jgi:hypothetical protein
MKSNRGGHGLKWDVCGALLTASTLAAAAPRDLGLEKDDNWIHFNIKDKQACI